MLVVRELVGVPWLAAEGAELGGRTDAPHERTRRRARLCHPESLNGGGLSPFIRRASKAVQIALRHVLVRRTPVAENLSAVAGIVVESPIGRGQLVCPVPHNEIHCTVAAERAVTVRRAQASAGIRSSVGPSQSPCAQRTTHACCTRGIRTLIT